MAASKKGRGLDEFRNTFDKPTIVTRRIQAALAQLGDGWEFETDFIKRCELSVAEFGRFRGPFEADHAIEVRGSGKRRRQVWVGSKAFAVKLRAVMAAQ